MIRILLGLILAAGMVQAQSATNPAPAAPPANAPQAAPTPAPVVAPGDAVITIHGLCSDAEKKAAGADANSCTTVITKQQYEDLLQSIVAPGAPAPPVTRDLAERYVELLTVSNAAEQAGIEKDPASQEYFRLRRMQALAARYGLELQAQYANPTQDEIETYYQKNLSQYEEVKLDRVFIPRTNPSAQNKDDFAKSAAAAAIDARDRVAKGEDPAQAEKEAYATLGLTSQPMKTDAGGMMRRNMFPPDESDDIFSLKPGDVSKIHDEPAGITFFKVESKDTVPLDKVKDEISHTVAQQDLQDRVKEITGSVHADYNDQYFPPAPPSAPPGDQQVPPSPPAAAPAPAPAPAPAQPKSNP
ncbi:MAG: peptidylprolyl isomerase [Candidatus Acidiferrales bacterium]